MIFSSPDWLSASSSLIGSKFFEWNEGEGRAGELRLKHVTQREPGEAPSFLFFPIFFGWGKGEGGEGEKESFFV